MAVPIGPKTTDIGFITGLVPHEVEQAILRLRESLDLAHADLFQARQTLAAFPRPLSIEEIQQALAPTGSNPLPTAGLLNTIPPPTNPVPPPPPTNPVPNHLDIAQAALTSLGINAGSTPEELFRYAQLVAWNIMQLGTDPPGLNVGLLMQGGGDGIFTCAGISYACFRICYDSGANIKILTGGFAAQWTQEADIPLTDYHVPTDPASGC